MEFPFDYDVLPLQEFDTAVPHVGGDHVMEVHAQVRDNGRVLDNYRVTFGGGRIFEVTTGLASILGIASSWRLKYQVWPRDVVIRGNMTSSKWIDFGELLESRQACFLMEDGTEVAQPTALELLQEGERPLAMRMAVVASDDGGVLAEMHCLPATAETLMGKPLLRG
jgi:hypothetical protein